MATPVLPLFPRIAHPDARPAIRFGAQQLDYGTLATACSAFRRTLADSGIKPGTRVGVWAQPELERMLGFLGCMCAGVVTVPLNAGLGEKELAHIVRDARIEAIFSAYPQQDKERTPGVPVHGFAFESDTMVAKRPPEQRGANEPALILYTS